MKKSFLFAAVVVASSISGSALALTAGVTRTPTIVGDGAVGTILAVPTLGPVGVGSPASPLLGACPYTLVWNSPFVPGASLICQAREARTFSNPSCPANAAGNINSRIEAGPASQLGATTCMGFDQLGNAYPGDGIVLSAMEFATGLVYGTLTYPANVFGPYPFTM